MFFKRKTTWYKAFGSVDEAKAVLKLGEPFYLLLQGKAFCVLRMEDGIYVMDDKCPHQGASLSQGECINHSIVCPWHQYRFSIRNGRQIGGAGDYLNTHIVEFRKEGVFFGVEKRPFW